MGIEMIRCGKKKGRWWMVDVVTFAISHLERAFAGWGRGRSGWVGWFARDLL